MDFWEVVKVFFRRWPITVPVVLLAVVAAVLIPPRIDPSYVASSSSVVITPSVEQVSLNPFLVLGSITMAQSLTISGQNGAAVEQVVANGGSATFSVTQQNARSPILIVTAEAATPEQAVATTGLVMEVVRSQLSGQQMAIGAPTQTHFYVQDLTGQGAAVPVYDGAQRVRFLALGLGVALAVTLALLVEGLSVVRSRRRGALLGDAAATFDERLAVLEQRERILVERARLLAERERAQRAHLGQPTPPQDVEPNFPDLGGDAVSLAETSAPPRSNEPPGGVPHDETQPKREVGQRESGVASGPR